MTRRRAKHTPQWWESLESGDKVVLTYTDQFVEEPVGTIAVFIKHEGGGLRLECPSGKRHIFDAKHWTPYTSEEQRNGIITDWDLFTSGE
jgi:hypothetical protein